jgi:hypothetical protein
MRGQTNWQTNLELSGDKKWGLPPHSPSALDNLSKLYLYSYHCQDIMPFYNFHIPHMTFFMVHWEGGTSFVTPAA